MSATEIKAGLDNMFLDENPNVIEADKYHTMYVNQIFGPPLIATEVEWVFYYDETNNIRKLYLTEKGTNAVLKNFVLGGIVHLRGQPIPDTTVLLKSLRIQASAKEIKFNQLASGQFLGILNSKRIQTLLQWLIDNKIHIHYTNFNILYWSLVDIIDSVLNDERVKEYINYIQHIKNELFNLSKFELDKFLQILNKYKYPNIHRSQTFSFMNEVADHFESFTQFSSASDIRGLVIELFRFGATLDELTFVCDNDDHILIDSFKDMYLRPMFVYPNSVHVYDEEHSIQEDLKDTVIKYQGGIVNYSFLDSKQCMGIQLSDGVCGLLGSYFNFLENHSLEQLKSLKAELNPNQQRTLELLGP